MEKNDADNIIKDKDKIILKRNECFHMIVAKRGRTAYFQKVAIQFDMLIGKCYNDTFTLDENGDIVTKHENDLDPNDFLKGDDDIIKDNRHFCSDGSSQKLTPEEIEALKEKGLSVGTMLSRIIENSTTFDNRTSFSQEKYVKRKLKKHNIVFQVLKPNIRTICNALNQKPSCQRALVLKLEDVSHVLLCCQLIPCSRILLVDSTYGFLLGAILERINGAATVLDFYHGKSHRDHGYFFTFPNDFYANTYPLPLWTLHHLVSKDNEGDPSESKRLRLSDSLETMRSSLGPKARRGVELLTTEFFHCLLIASKLDPLPLLRTLIARLQPGSPIVVYCPNREGLLLSAEYLSQVTVGVELRQVCSRHYQVLPERTHPQIKDSSYNCNGYILSLDCMTDETAIHRLDFLISECKEQTNFVPLSSSRKKRDINAHLRNESLASESSVCSNLGKDDIPDQHLLELEISQLKLEREQTLQTLITTREQIKNKEQLELQVCALESQVQLMQTRLSSLQSENDSLQNKIKMYEIRDELFTKLCIKAQEEDVTTSPSAMLLSLKELQSVINRQGVEIKQLRETFSNLSTSFST